MGQRHLGPQNWKFYAMFSIFAHTDRAETTEHNYYPNIIGAVQRRRQSTRTRGTMGSFGGAHGERVEREPIRGSGGRAPSRELCF